VADTKGKKKSSTRRQKKSSLSGGRSAGRSSSKFNTAEPYIALGKDRWPLERDVFFRPDRLKYVRKLVRETGCVFCRAATEPISLDTLCFYKTEHSMMVLNKYPYNSGHILVIPRRHIADMLDLKEEEYIDLHQTLRRGVAMIRDEYRPGGMNIGLNLGSVAGAGIPDHLHYHVIPRWSGDANFFPLVAETKLVVENLETSFDRLLTFVRKNSP
jgi:ATP adenylyltransferase